MVTFFVLRDSSLSGARWCQKASEEQDSDSNGGEGIVTKEAVSMKKVAIEVEGVPLHYIQSREHDHQHSQS